MNPLTAQQIADILGAHVAVGDPGVLVTGGVSTDSRRLAPGCLFIALQGENYNADSFASAALTGGAAVAIVHSWIGEAPAGKAVIPVLDTLLALQRLALWWRKQLDIPVVAITGSNGKTSTKDFTAAVLARKFNVSATRGNLNNHIGVPLTVLSATQDHTAAVWEMGMNHAGEIAPLCEIARPKFGIITNIGTAHIEFLGSRDAIAEEKSTVARALPECGCLFLPASCEYFDYIRQRTKAHVVAVGNGRGAVRAENLRCDMDGSTFSLVIEGHGSADVSLHVPGKHMVTNALLAAAVGWKLGMAVEEIAAGLSSASLTGGRLKRFDWNGVTVIDDTYNANPESMAAAIDTLADMPLANGGSKFIVLGRMGELGPHAPEAHHRTGALAASRGLRVVAVGEGAEGIAAGANDAPFFPDLVEAGRWLSTQVQSGDAVLFKGSRTATVETTMHTAFPIH
jgi:UDP-N-acetylmuramoyl-tripeptide--D-alanyl-D-alanine ligase